MPRNLWAISDIINPVSALKFYAKVYCMTASFLTSWRFRTLKPIFYMRNKFVSCIAILLHTIINFYYPTYREVWLKQFLWSMKPKTQAGKNAPLFTWQQFMHNKKFNVTKNQSWPINIIVFLWLLIKSLKTFQVKFFSTK